MKKKIIASILVVVMLVLTLASCGAYDFREEDLSGYVTVDQAKLLDALANIEIEDGDFGHLESTRQQKIKEAVYSAFATKLVAYAAENEKDKLKEGTIGDKDIVYFGYYCTDADGNVYYYDRMNAPANLKDDKTDKEFFINLGSYDEDNEVLNKIADALKGQNIADHAYVTSGKSDMKDNTVKLGDKLVITYKRTYNLYKVNDAGKFVDAAGNEVANDSTEKVLETEVTEVATYELVEISKTSENKFIATLSKYVDDVANGTDKLSVIKVGETIKVNSKPGDATNTSTATSVNLTETDVTYGEKKYPSITYTYSDMKVLWKVDSEGSPLQFTHTPFATEEGKDPVEKKVVVSTLHNTNDKGNDLTDKELTYYIYPIYRLAMPEITAVNILEYVYGKDITLRVEDDTTTTKNEAKEPSFDLFENEAYAASVKTVIEAVQKLYGEKYDDGSALDIYAEIVDNVMAAAGALDDLIDSVVAAEKAVTVTATNTAIGETDTAITALNKVVTAAEAAVTAAQTAYDNETDAAKKADLQKILDARVALKAAADKAVADVTTVKTALEAAKTAGTSYEAATEQADKDAKKTAFADALTAAFDAVDAALDSQNDALEAAESTVVEKQREAIRAEFSKMAALTRTEGEQTKTFGEELVKEYNDDQYEDLEHKYKDDIINKVKEAVYTIIFDNNDIVKVTGYPEEVVNDFYKNLYESYEHDFYKGKVVDEKGNQTEQTNYSKYGTLHAYLYSVTDASKYNNGDEKEAIKAAITAEAKEKVEPLLKLYAVAKILDTLGAGDILKGYYQADINAGVYDSTFEPEEYKYDDSISASKNEKAKKKLEKQNEQNAKNAEENAQKNKDSLIEAAENFLVDDAVYKAYKKLLGSVRARQYEEYYGEINIRAMLQMNRVFDYLTYYEKEYDSEEKHADAKQISTAIGEGATADTEYKLNFGAVNYKFKAD